MFFHCVLLSVALFAPLPLFVWYGYSSSEMAGVWAAAVAAVVCWFGGVVALVLAGVTRGTPAAVHATLMGIFFRTGVPLVTGLLLQRAGGELARGGVFGMILGYYFWALIVETLLSVRLVGAAVAKQSVARG